MIIALTIESDIESQRCTRPFTQGERNAIIQAFEQSEKNHEYADFVKFLFLNGVRLGEAIALQWKI